jgi:uncharacterized membrane protein YphA (DoxX/SURF4 family)
MTQKRKLLLLRLVLGCYFVWRSWDMLGNPQQTTETVATTGNWSGWPLIGQMRPLEMTFTVAFVLFGLGIFLMGGLLVRILSTATVVFALMSFAIFGLNSWLSHTLVLVAALVIMLRGGGAGTMDAALGAMQRRTLEREAEREAARLAERALKEQDAAGASA